MKIDDFEQIRQLAYRYAQAVDRRNVALLASCFAPGIEIITPGVPTMRGNDVAREIVDIVSGMFSKTQHRVFNTLFELEGDAAQGETYCSALHLLPADDKGEVMNLEMCIRYQDDLQRTKAGWQFSRRELVVDWQERRLVLPG